MSKLQAPFPWFGGKSAVADICWQRFGAVGNYVEPFFGSGAMLLRRPEWSFADVIPRETINDRDGHVANFWRSVKQDPEGTAAAADRLVSELDLHAIGDALFCRPSIKWPQPPQEFVEWIRDDESHYCPERAGAWAWFVSNWIGGLPSVNGNAHVSVDGEVHHRRPHLGNAGRGVARKRPHLGNAGQGVARQLPHLGNAGRGVARKLPHLGDAGQGVARQLPHLGNAGRGECAQARAALQQWMGLLSDRLRRVRVCCGSWDRICGPSPTFKNGLTGVFLDPPYSAEASRANDLYSHEDLSVAHAVRDWCVANGDNPELRIALCGYEGEGHEVLEQHGWAVHAWKASGGYASQGSQAYDNCHRERIWFSPHCLQPGTERWLF